MTSNARRIEDLLDRAELHDLVTAVTQCLDTRNFDALAEVYTADATLETPAGRSSGAAAIIELARGNHEIYAATQHFVSGLVIAADGATATVTADVLAVFVPVRERPDEHRMLGSRYAFRAERGEHGWRFTRHTITPIWIHGHTAAMPPVDSEG
ncbi:nuclear transport factor 2 family protein [Nocardia brasiliensis]